MSVVRPLPDRLRDDEATWCLVESQVLPRVLAALRRRYGPGRHWHDLEGFVRSAERTALRRLRTRADRALEQLQTLAQFENWLVVVAGHRFHRALQRAAAEEALRPTLSQQAAQEHGLEELTSQSAAEVLAELERALEDDFSRAVFRGKLEQKPEAQLASELRCSTRKVRGVWQRVRQRLLRRADDLAAEAEGAPGE